MGGRNGDADGGEGEGGGEAGGLGGGGENGRARGEILGVPYLRSESVANRPCSCAIVI